jgi:hypothetical protein
VLPRGELRRASGVPPYVCKTLKNAGHPQRPPKPLGAKPLVCRRVNKSKRVHQLLVFAWLAVVLVLHRSHSGRTQVATLSTVQVVMKTLLQTNGSSARS